MHLFVVFGGWIATTGILITDWVGLKETLCLGEFTPVQWGHGPCLAQG
jgi:hypothetical protein